MVLHLDRGDRVDQRYILHRLAELQYTRNDMAFQRGAYRVRGDVIDIFPAESAKEAVRVELFDDEIDNIGHVRSADGRGLEPLAALYRVPQNPLCDAPRTNPRGSR